MADRKNINPRRPIPATGYDKLRDNLNSNFKDGFPALDFPPPDNRPNMNRGNITTRNDDSVKDIYIGLQDHDEAIMYYFNNVIKEKFTHKNRYDNFSVLQNRIAQKEMHAVVVPDYIKLQYTCTIWTDYVAQMNKLIETINYASDAYWGDPEKFNFNAKIDTYSNTTEISQGEDRIVKTDFGLTLQGYLIPDSINKELSKRNQKYFTKSIVTFNTEAILETATDNMTREEVRNKNNPNVIQMGGGIGFDQVGTSLIT